ncbi:hypothetical protein [Bizionia myxarmorum]|uniref:Uncharacterized protein n=1 Tax=Bizionia myxarmorum TaxID=291186 RepID=A0A5D0R4I1_9FLAO|nr:hypothetical protein [Bizionia myxarmorum]TYB76372.1 hypothetical protein ES674_12350 [Bizionia myxarmorum]
MSRRYFKPKNSKKNLIKQFISFFLILVLISYFIINYFGNNYLLEFVGENLYVQTVLISLILKDLFSSFQNQSKIEHIKIKILEELKVNMQNEKENKRIERESGF